VTPPSRAIARRAATSLVVLVLGTAPAAAVALPPNPPTVSKTRTALGRLTVHSHTTQPVYQRSKFGTSWISQGNGCTTRDRVLIRDGLDAMADAGCTITAVHWRSVYDGLIFTVKSRVDIDHVVPLGNAWVSGASTWTRARRVLFANDLTDSQLIAVSVSSNRSKGNRGPEVWKPPRAQIWCLYARWWVDVKTVWRLTVTGDEKRALRSMLDTC
jgi:hypothetical protein